IPCLLPHWRGSEASGRTFPLAFAGRKRLRHGLREDGREYRAEAVRSRESDGGPAAALSRVAGALSQHVSRLPPKRQASTRPGPVANKNGARSRSMHHGQAIVLASTIPLDGLTAANHHR